MKKRLSILALCVVSLSLAFNTKVVHADENTNNQVQPTIINKTSVIKINYNGLGGVAVWSNYDSNKKVTGQYLKNATRWQSFRQVTVDGTTWYNLGGNQWVSGQYVETDVSTQSSSKPVNTNSGTDSAFTVSPYSGIVRISYNGLGGVAVWSNYDSSKKITGQYLKNATNWKAFKVATGKDGSKWYNLGGNQWVSGQYITTATTQNTNVIQTGTGLTYQTAQKRYVYVNNGTVEKGQIAVNKTTYYTDSFGGIYAVKNAAPIIGQRPQLPTGCEMTAVTMLLQYAGVNIDKMEVAKETPRSNNGNTGFVGDPTKTSGWWVFPSGIAPVVNRHLGHSDIMTGASMSSIKDKLVHGHVVVAWVANVNGFVNHALLLTGYNNNGTIYYNNPWTAQAESMSESSFVNHWSLDEKRALSY